MLRSALQAARSENAGWTYIVSGHQWYFNEAESGQTRVYVLSKIDIRGEVFDML
jgi:hypothetical protein